MIPPDDPVIIACQFGALAIVYGALWLADRWQRRRASRRAARQIIAHQLMAQVAQGQTRAATAGHVMDLLDAMDLRRGRLASIAVLTLAFLAILIWRGS